MLLPCHSELAACNDLTFSKHYFCCGLLWQRVNYGKKSFEYLDGILKRPYDNLTIIFKARVLNYY
jgi:hypothetical protein